MAHTVSVVVLLISFRRYLTDQLQKVHVVNETNKDFVIEALRSIAELMIYGDQHDSSFFEYFMEKQIMGEFARILRISKLSRVSLQLLQTMSIMIQNLRNEHSIYYIFSNEHINFLIAYPFDFQIDEMLSYYISFLRAISGKLNKNTISLLVKTKNDEVTSFPLYVEALKFAFHEDGMIRVAIRTLTLNVYHVGDESVNRFVSRAPLSDYFSDMVQHFQKQCIDLDKLVAHSSRNANSSLPMSSVEDTMVQIEDTLYYFSDVMSSGIPDLERFITENILQVLVFRLLLPSLQSQNTDLYLSVTTSMYLLCCILHIFKNKDMASTVAAALFHQPDCADRKQETFNGYTTEHDCCSSASAVKQSNEDKPITLSSVSWKHLPNHLPPSDCGRRNTPRYVTVAEYMLPLIATVMKVTLKARGLWRVVQEYVTTLGSKNTANEAWLNLEAIRVSNDHVKMLRREFETIAFCYGEVVEDFTLCLLSLVSQLGVLGEKIEEEAAVAKYLRVVPSKYAKYAQVVVSIETLLDLTTLNIEDVTGRLKVVEDRAESPMAQGEDAPASSSIGCGRRRWKPRKKAATGETKEEGAKAGAKDKCANCGKTGHWVRNCHAPRHREQVNLAQEEEEPALNVAEEAE
ncbi:hypothetical protein U9M48_031415 [Paspalum notatum var. saurae]|uniref:CCHC-type domain-containing protein n=1 Tax=Paspalum notatum var. saurae TaxID=547442 RepID=A0AAQ3U7C0_PASNO